ncbi:MAG TPA: hypothetical protein PLP25_02775 [Candidatus Limiplasma sp.]|nr:hypothetical protein [Candidatus Limiplasma sp.]HPS80771.1 hypothetical protein [Candidatus Limiplasma sp.]
MDATASLGTWKRYLGHALAFAALLGCAYFFPPLAFVFAFTLPLAVCPMIVEGDVWFALALPVAPAAALILGGGDAVIGVLLMVFPYLCLLTVSVKQRWRLSFIGEILVCAGAFALSAMGMLLRLSELLGAPLFSGLAEYAVQTIQSSALSGNLLYRLTQLGFLTVPEAYSQTTGIQFGGMIWLNPALQRELMNMLRLRLIEGLTQWIPSLLVQGAVILGLFTTLSTERTRARRAEGTRIVPAFTLLRLSRREQGFMLMLCIGTALTSLTDNGVTSLVCALMYAAFTTVYQLLGAAVMVFSLTRRHPERKTLYGVFAAILYLIFPVALFLLGVVDQFVNLRAFSIHHQDQEEE